MVRREVDEDGGAITRSTLRAGAATLVVAGLSLLTACGDGFDGVGSPPTSQAPGDGAGSSGVPDDSSGGDSSSSDSSGGPSKSDPGGNGPAEANVVTKFEIDGDDVPADDVRPDCYADYDVGTLSVQAVLPDYELNVTIDLEDNTGLSVSLHDLTSDPDQLIGIWTWGGEDVDLTTKWADPTLTVEGDLPGENGPDTPVDIVIECSSVETE